MAVTEPVRPLEGTEVSIDEAVKWMKFWFKPSDITSIVGLGDGSPQALTFNRDTLIKYIEKDFDKLTGDGTNVYFMTATAQKAQQKRSDSSHRTKKQDFKAMRGVWVDLDCGKEGAFESPEAVDEFIESLVPKPGAIVKTGSGGAHVYWKIKDPNNIVVDEAGLRWWSYIQSLAPEGVSIDRLTDVKTRILRLPGSVRWPKPGEDAKPKQVVVRYTDAPAINADDILMYSETSYPEAQNDAKKRRAHLDRVSTELGQYAAALGPWSMATILADIDTMVHSAITWQELLESHGWTCLGNSGNAVLWQRPGSDQKSATTDYEGDATRAMSLLSDSPDTGLLDLKENDEPISLWRAVLRLNFNDNVAEALDWIAENAN